MKHKDFIRLVDKKLADLKMEALLKCITIVDEPTMDIDFSEEEITNIVKNAVMKSFKKL